MEFSLSDDDRLLLETADRFASEHLEPPEREHEAERGYPEQLIASYAELGLDGLEIDLPRSVWTTVWRRLAQADAGAPLGLSRWGCAAATLRDAPWAAPLLETGRPGSVAFLEDGARQGDRVTVELPWIPRGDVGWLLVADSAGLALVNEPAFAPLDGRACGLQACGGVSISLDDVGCVPVASSAEASALVDEARVLVSALMLGAARDALERAMTYAQERVAFGRPIAHHQGLAFLLMEAATRLDGADLLLDAAAFDGDATAIACAHAHAGDVAMTIAERAVQTLGGHGYLTDHPVEKRMRDIRALATLYGGLASAEADAAEHILESQHALELIE